MAHLVLEYLRVLLSAPVMLAAVAALFLLLFREDLKALFLRIAKIRFPGGAEFSTSQSERIAPESADQREPNSIPTDSSLSLPDNLDPTLRSEIQNLLDAERANARIWEYRLLTYFLVPHTQRALDWLAGFPQPVAANFYYFQWWPIIPNANERDAIINALQAHHLVQTDANSIVVTAKGYEYIRWRGTLPSSF